MSKVFVHEQVGDFVVCQYCDQLTLYPVSGFYCSSVCMEIDRERWWQKILSFFRRRRP